MERAEFRHGLALGLLAAGAIGSLVAAEAEGWRNQNPNRRLNDRVGVVWEADFSLGANGFSLEKCAGAEGELFFEDGKLGVRKTNYRGYLRVNAIRSFAKPVGSKLKSFADAEVANADPNYSLAFPRIVDSRNLLTPCVELDATGVFMWGGEKMAYLANTAPGEVSRRFSNFKVCADGGTDLHPVLVISGAPSVTRWQRWGIQDYDVAAVAWKKVVERHQADGRAGTNLEDLDVFERRLAADIDHTAKITTGNGGVRLVVDGQDEVPVLFKNPRSWGESWGDFNGVAMAREGLRLQCFEIGSERHWSNGVFNVELAVRDIRDRMRVSPESLTVLSVYMSMPKEYAVRHPTEIWRHPDGTPCVGQFFRMCSRHYNSPVNRPCRTAGVWPWVSCASKIYERDMKDILTQVVMRLRQDGLAKRIVGFHFGGWHDGQFSMYRADYSEPAKRGFRDYLNSRYGSAPENLKIPVPDSRAYYNPKTDRLAYDWNAYQHLLPFRFQESMARHVKQIIGKDVICLHWSMDVYCDVMGGSFYFDAFLNSDAMDGLITQPPYIRRLPGYTVGITVPLASFARHSKLYLDEFDLRAWGEIPHYVKEESISGLGFAMDLPEWEAVNHKMAGRMIAKNQGYWYYDISGGFWNPDEIERDIGESVRIYAEQRRRSGTRWTPSAAMVVDSDGFYWCNFVGANKNPCGRGVVEGQASLLAASGVPYDEFTYDDVVGDKAVLAPYKVVVLAGFRELDESRRRWLNGLARLGKTLILLAGTGGYRDRVRPVGTSPEIIAVDPARQDEFVSRFAAMWQRWSLNSMVGDLARETMPMSYAFDETEGTEVLARYAVDGAPAVIRRGAIVAIGQTEGLSPRFFNRLVREAGGYVTVENGLQVDMNGDFMSLCALDNGEFELKMPFPCKVVNLKSGTKFSCDHARLKITMTAGEVRWYRLEAEWR